jgi:hypothetical protein
LWAAGCKWYFIEVKLPSLGVYRLAADPLLSISTKKKGSPRLLRIAGRPMRHIRGTTNQVKKCTTSVLEISESVCACPEQWSHVPGRSSAVRSIEECQTSGTFRRQRGQCRFGSNCSGSGNKRDLTAVSKAAKNSIPEIPLLRPSWLRRLMKSMKSQ